jgi:hypothetical protein
MRRVKGPFEVTCTSAMVAPPVLPSAVVTASLATSLTVSSNQHSAQPVTSASHIGSSPSGAGVVTDWPPSETSSVFQST